MQCLPISVSHCSMHVLTQQTTIIEEISFQINSNKSFQKMNFFTNIKLLFVVTILIVLNSGLARARTLQISKYDSIIAPTNRNFHECTGSLILETPKGEEKRFAVSKRRTRLRAKNVRVEGCGCFHVYQRPGFRATSRLISSSMKKVSGDKIGFRIRSIEKVPCVESIYY